MDLVTFFGLTATVSRAFPLAGRFFTGFAAAFFTAAFLAVAFLAVTFFIAVFFVTFFFSKALEGFFAFLDLSASFLATFAAFAGFAGFDLAEPALSGVEGETFALDFDTLGLALDADRPDFFSLALVVSRALVAIGSFTS